MKKLQLRYLLAMVFCALCLLANLMKDGVSSIGSPMFVLALATGFAACACYFDRYPVIRWRVTTRTTT